MGTTNQRPRLSESVPTKFRNGKWVRKVIKAEVNVIPASVAARTISLNPSLQQRIAQLDGQLASLLPTSALAKKVEQEVRALRAELAAKTIHPAPRSPNAFRPCSVPGYDIYGVPTSYSGQMKMRIQREQQAREKLFRDQIAPEVLPVRHGVTDRRPSCSSPTLPNGKWVLLNGKWVWQ